MLLSVICPVLNEAEHIQEVIDFFVDAGPVDKELILIDGGSVDGTVSIIQQNCLSYPDIRLLHNPKKIVPAALNIAIPLCNGDYIVRLDGHSRYASDYFERILQVFAETDAGIVGGPTRTESRTSTQEAIGFAISHPVGIGGSKVHDEHFEGYTDSVTFGAWRKEIFAVTGLFDERLVRNQDDEFHYRAKSKGIKIYQHPGIILHYFPRGTYRSLFKQYFQYGLYKPLVLHKIKSEVKIRHIVPLLFVLYLFTLPFATHGFMFLPLVFYCILVLTVAFSNNKSFFVRLLIFLAIPVIHIAYGLGCLFGCIKLLLRR